MSEGTYDTESKNTEQQKNINDDQFSRPEDEIREVEILKDDILSGTFDANEINNWTDDEKTLVLQKNKLERTKQTKREVVRLG